MIDSELEKYFSDMDVMFDTAGWKTLVGDLSFNATNIDSIEQAKTLEDLHFRKGQLIVIAQIVNLEASTRDAHEQAIIEAEEAVEDGS
tara:strand:- start:2117 stop:2380 length:264 start_codon:yes stop_codon:yes gene_type:complete